jgi:polar amino acid transport system permease protein
VDISSLFSKIPWAIILSTVRVLLKGMVVTVEVTLAALAIGLVLGLFMGIGRVYGGKFIGIVLNYYVLIIRAVPPILTLFILFFVITSIINLSPLLAGIISLGLASGAYQTEIIRGAILSVPESQLIAARAIGMDKKTAIFNIILPQAFRFAIAPWSNEVALVVKNSSLVYVLGIPEMMRQAQYAAARTYEPFLIFSIAALMYFLLVFAANKGLGAMERKFKIPTSELSL